MGDVYVGANADSTGGVKLVRESELPVESGTAAGSVKTKDFSDGTYTYSNVATGYGSYAEGGNNHSTGLVSHAEGQNTQASGTGAHSEGGSATTASGMFAHAEGWGTTASKNAAHSEGQTTTASGVASHAEGRNTTASASNSHAEGYGNTASGNAAHVEGRSNTASGQNTHVEGQSSTGTGMNSHIEGFGSIGHGNNVHVEGMYNNEDSLYPNWISGTEYHVGDRVINTTNNIPYECKTSNSDIEFDQSKWINIVNNSSYAHIVGNGSYNDRSNAYALTWTGDGHYAGDVYVHSNADSTGGTKLATIEDIPEVPVQDVQVNGASVVSDGVANVPVVTNNTGVAGVAKIDTAYGLDANNGYARIYRARTDAIKASSGTYQPIVPAAQHYSVFYGLAKAAGFDEKDSTLPMGQYTDEAKAAIRTMLDVPATGDIPSVPVTDVRVAGNSVVADGVANIQIATGSKLGVAQGYNSRGVGIDGSGRVFITGASLADIKPGANTYNPVVPSNQHISVFYGLAKAAGYDEKNSTESFGTYTDEAKTAIKTMIGVPTMSEILTAVHDSYPAAEGAEF